MRKIAFFILLLVWVGFLKSQVVSNFNNGLENWAVEGDSDYEWSSSLGNSGGCLVVHDYAVGDINRAYAPNKFLGDWSTASLTDYISMDIYLNTPENIYIEDINYVFEIIGPVYMLGKIVLS